MKINLFILGFLSLAFCPLFAQDTLYVYYDKDWNEISDNSDTAYYRKAFQEEGKWIVNDYYVSDTIQMEGVFSTEKFEMKEGLFIYYYKNGNKKSEGPYSKNKLLGEWTYWYENGGKKSEGKYLNNSGSGNWMYWYENGIVKAEGALQAGKKQGDWKYYYESGGLSLKESYDIGVIEYAERYFENGTMNFFGAYKKGDRYGEWKFWNREGRLVNQGAYNKGLKDGVWKRSYKDGYRNIVFKKGVNTSNEVGGIVRRGD